MKTKSVNAVAEQEHLELQDAELELLEKCAIKID